jgi:hypothetical protein
MYRVYRMMRFMVDQGLPLPPRIDFSYYVASTGATYPQLLNRVLDDADATWPSLGASPSYAAAETFYFVDDVQRHQFGQAFAAEAATSTRLTSATFWTTPDGGGSGADITYPFAFEDYLPPAQTGSAKRGQRELAPPQFWAKPEMLPEPTPVEIRHIEEPALRSPWR